MSDAFDDHRALVDRLLLDEGPELVLIADPAAGQLLSARGAGDRVLGIPTAQLAGRPLSSLEPKASVGRELVPFDASMLNGTGTFSEVAIAAADGARVVSVRVQTFEHAGRPLTLVRLLDVSAQHRLSSELRQVHQQLQQAFHTLREQEHSLAEARRAASLSVFAAGLAHELNNPIAVIVANASSLGFSVDQLKQAASQGQPVPSDPVFELGEITTEMSAVAKRVAAIIASLKELETVPRAGRFDAVATVRAVLTKWPGVRLSGPERLEVTTDSGLLKRALEKLLDNARRAVGPTGQVGVEVHDDGQRLHVQVDDLGPGVPPEHRERIFDPFFSLRPPGEGLGLGLFLARRAAHRLGGDITLDPLPTPGTRFRVSVPLVMPAPAPDKKSYEDLRSGKR